MFLKFYVVVPLQIVSVLLRLCDNYPLNSQVQLDSCPWKEHKADNGRIYYHNTETKESRWAIPKELAELKGEYHGNAFT